MSKGVLQDEDWAQVLIFMPIILA